MLPAGQRLTAPIDFSTVLRSRNTTRVGGSLITVYLFRNPQRLDQLPRVGLTVSRAVGNAVSRNRVKRRLREQARSVLPRIHPGSDLVIRAHPAAARASSAALGAQFVQLCGKAKVLR